MLTQFILSSTKRSRSPFIGSHYRTLTGVVQTVSGDVIKIHGCPNARVRSLLTFQSGAVGCVTELYGDGSVRAVLVWGDGVSPGSGVLAESSPPTLPPSTSSIPDAYLGRVVNPLGLPLDNLGDLRPPSWSSSVSAPSHPAAFFPLASPSIVSRAPLRDTLPTGFKAIDALLPILRGSCLALSGSGVLERERLALDVVSTLAQRGGQRSMLGGVWGDDSSFVRCIYVSVGASRARISNIISSLASSGALPSTCVVAAPAGDPCVGRGAFYLAPFLGMALGDVWRDRGSHVFVVVDDLTEHAKAVRGVEGAHGIMPSALQAGLVDRCAQLSEEFGGGSLTGLFLMDSQEGVGESQGSASSVKSSVNSFELSRTRDALSEEGGVGSGKTSSYLVNTASLCDGGNLVLSSRASAYGALLPIDFERLQGCMGHRAQGEAMRYYAMGVVGALGEMGEVAKGVALGVSMGIHPEAELDPLLDLYTKARLLLCPTEPMLRSVLAVANQHAVQPRPPGDSGEGGDPFLPLGLQDLMLLKSEDEESALQLAAQDASPVTPRKSAAALAASASLKRGPFIRSFSTASGAAFDERLESLKKKLDPEQRRTLEAVRALRGGSSGPVPKKHRVAASQEGMNMNNMSNSAPASGRIDYNALYGESVVGGGLAEEEEAGADSETETDWGQGPANTTQDIAGSQKTTQPFTQRRFFSSSASSTSTPNETPTAAVARSRPRFVIPGGHSTPQHRTPPAQLFEINEEALRTKRGSGTSDGGILKQLGWENGPHRGDPGRVFLNLFLITHGYISKVPLSRLFAYERGLWLYLSKIPAPPIGSQRSRRGGGDAQLPESGGGLNNQLFLAPSSSDILGYQSLMHAALETPIPPEMANCSRRPMAETLHDAHLAEVTASAAASRAVFEKALEEGLRRAAEAKEREKLSRGNFFFGALFRDGSKENSLPVSPPLPPPVQASVDTASPSDAPGSDLVWDSVRTEPGLPLHELPPALAALHVSVAAYTVIFCKEEGHFIE